MKVVFHVVVNIPNIIGCVDCIHVKIATLAINEYDYVKRISDHTINIQPIYDTAASIMNGVVRCSVYDTCIPRV